MDSDTYKTRLREIFAEGFRMNASFLRMAQQAKDNGWAMFCERVILATANRIGQMAEQ